MQDPATPQRSRRRLNLQAISDLAALADYTFAFAVRAIASIGVADQLQDQPLHIDVLADRSGCDSHALLRVLRALVTKGVFAEVAAETFALTPLSDLMRTDHPYSMRWFFRLQPDVQAMADLEYSVRTGEPAFEKRFGKDYFEWLEEHDLERERFHGSQRSLNRLELLAVTRAYPWSEVSTVVDIGGNDGSLLEALLDRFPAIHGTVFDRPETAPEAAKVFASRGLSARTAVVGGDVLKGGIPGAANIYITKRILVGFSDEQVVCALSNIREAMGPESRLLIMEPMETLTDDVGTSLDMRMLVLGLGRVRSTTEFEDLLQRAGMIAQRTIPAKLLTIIEARRSDA